MKICRPLLLAIVSLLSSSIEFVKGTDEVYAILKLCSVAMSFPIKLSIGFVELSPSPVAPVCQAGDQLELTF